MQMVGHRHSKFELVALVNWLLVKHARLRAEIAAMYRADLTKFVAAYGEMRHRFGDEYDGRFSECDELVKLHLADKPTMSEA